MKLIARYLAEFNREYWDRESPGPWSTLMVIVVVMVIAVIVWTYPQ